MANRSTRRDFLQTCGAMAATAVVSASSPLPTLKAAFRSEKRWFKGNLHMHNQWSDGEPLPEWAVDWYKSHGYHFICPSDHNMFQAETLRFGGFGFDNQPSDLAAFRGETSLWKEISPEAGWPKLTQSTMDATVNKFGSDAVRTITVGGKTYVRMTPFAELERRFVEPDRFLMIPGYEQTGGCTDERQVHMNLINVREVFPYISGETPRGILEQTWAKASELYAGQDYLFTANHPLWKYYDYSPADLIALPQIRLFELNNNDIDGTYDAHPQGWTPEKFWDVVNAYRAAQGQPLLLGMGSDDRHGYGSDPEAWSVVRAASLAVGDLLEAIRQGDFYASNGLDLHDIQFDGRTLAVKLHVQQEGRYRIQFLGTKKDYDPSSRVVEVAKGARCPARKIDLYSESIGVVLDTIDGTEGGYTLKPDDLYVCAKIVKVTEDVKADWRSRPAAWTQPYC